MKTIKTYIAIFITTALILSSCTERIDINLDDTYPRVVIFGEITTDTMAHKISVTKSASYFSNEKVPAVSGAEVSIDNGDEVIYLTEDANEPGSYLTPADYFGEPGKTYSLRVTNLDIDNDGNMDVYEASSSIYKAPTIDSIKVIYMDGIDGWKVELYAMEPGETENYYTFKVYNNDVLLSDTINEVETTDDEFFNGGYALGNWVYYIDEMNGDYVEVGDTITLEMGNISKEYYHFINEVQLESGYKDPMFSGPPANISGNISNGAIGFFEAYDLDRSSVIYKGEIEKLYK